MSISLPLLFPGALDGFIALGFTNLSQDTSQKEERCYKKMFKT